MANNNPGAASAITPQQFPAMTNCILGGVYSINLTPAGIAANTTGTLTVSNSGLGLIVGDYVQVQLQGAQTAGIITVAAWVSAADTLAVTWGNLTGASLTPVNGVYKVLVFRPDPYIAQQNPAIQP